MRWEDQLLQQLDQSIDYGLGIMATSMPFIAKPIINLFLCWVSPFLSFICHILDIIVCALFYRSLMKLYVWLSVLHHWFNSFDAYCFQRSSFLDEKKLIFFLEEVFVPVSVNSSFWCRKVSVAFPWTKSYHLCLHWFNHLPCIPSPDLNRLGWIYRWMCFIL